jgi:hypothetical protein
MLLSKAKLKPMPLSEHRTKDSRRLRRRESRVSILTIMLTTMELRLTLNTFPLRCGMA